MASSWTPSNQFVRPSSTRYDTAITDNITADTSSTVNSRPSGWPDQVAGDHQHRRHEERDLHRRSHCDAEGQVHLALASDENRGRVLGGVTDHGDDDDAHEHLAEAELGAGLVDRADEELADQADRRRRGDERDRLRVTVHAAGDRPVTESISSRLRRARRAAACRGCRRRHEAPMRPELEDRLAA